MVDLEKAIKRFENLKEFQKELGREIVQASFTERDIKEILYLLGELKTIKESDGLEKLEQIKEVISNDKLMVNWKTVEKIKEILEDGRTDKHL